MRKWIDGEVRDVVGDGDSQRELPESVLGGLEIPQNSLGSSDR